MQFPEYRELSRIDPIMDERSEPPSDIEISADRTAAVQYIDGELVCRRTSDLETLWSRPIAANLRIHPISVSADSNYVAGVLAKGSFDGQFRHYSILGLVVYDGRTGKEISRFQSAKIEGAGRGIAISPDGRFVAVVVREFDRKGEAIPTVYIHDAHSGKALGSVAHDRIGKTRRQFIQAGCTVAFTPDGKYLVTSGMSTKVWRVS
jgi:hypothetical protein